MQFSRCFYILISILWFYASGVCFGETLADLQRELLQKNPEIMAAKNRYFAARKLPVQERTLPDPTISFVDLGVGHPFSKLFSEFAYLGFGFSQELPFPGKLALKSKIASKNAEVARQEFKSTALRLLSELKTSFAEYYYLNRAIHISEENRDLLEQLTKIAETRYRVGQGLQQDILRSQVEISTLAAKLQLLHQQVGAVQASINALLNRDPSAELKPVETLPETSLNLTLEHLEESLRENSPQMQSKIRMQEGSNLGVQLSKKELYPDFSASFQWQKTGADFRDYYMTTFEVRIPLYAVRRQKPAIAEAELELRASQNETEATLRQLLAELKNQYLRATTTATLLKLYREGIIPQTHISLESALTAYQVGKVDFLTLLSNASSLLNYQSEYERQLADHEQAIARIEAITGVAICNDTTGFLKELENE